MNKELNTDELLIHHIEKGQYQVKKKSLKVAS